jgi:hypothetical protein
MIVDAVESIGRQLPAIQHHAINHIARPATVQQIGAH